MRIKHGARATRYKLQDQIKHLQSENKRLKDALVKRGIHTKDCFKVRTLGQMNCTTPEEAECTCGLDQALKGD